MNCRWSLVPKCRPTITSVQPAIGVSAGAVASIANAAFRLRGRCSVSVLASTGT